MSTPNSTCCSRSGWRSSGSPSVSRPPVSSTRIHAGGATLLGTATTPREGRALGDAGVDLVRGVHVELDHADLARLYHDDAPAIGGHRYLPHAVLTHTAAGTLRPTLTYVCADMADAAPEPAYVHLIAAAARDHGLPAEHIRWIETFGTGEEMA
jgi:hypothetical protein